MLEISLSAVAAFAAYTRYVIVKDELDAQRAQLNISARKSVMPEAPAPKTSPGRRAVQAQKDSPQPTRSLKSKVAAANEPVTLAADAILSYLSEQRPASLKKLGQVLKIDIETIQAASETLVAKQEAVATKKRGYPGLAPRIDKAFTNFHEVKQ